ncbi:MAG: hypothetical protein ACO3R5_14265 [Pseudohongiellaceae bacterium]
MLVSNFLNAVVDLVGIGIAPDTLTFDAVDLTALVLAGAFALAFAFARVFGAALALGGAFVSTANSVCAVFSGIVVCSLDASNAAFSSTLVLLCCSAI